MSVSKKFLFICLLVLVPLLIWLILRIFAFPSSPAYEEKSANDPEIKPFYIGLSLALTGRYSGPAAMQKMAYQLWEIEINKKGGFLGREVKIIIVDDESDVNKAKEAYRYLILDKRVNLVFGPFSSSIAEAVVPIVNKFGYPMLAAGSAADSIWRQGFKNVFGMWTPASRYSIGFLNLAVLEGLKKVAIVHADDEFSIEVAKGSQKWSAILGLEVVIFEEFKKGTKDLVPLARKAREAEAELLLVGGHFDESVDMRRALKQINWYPKAFFATVGPATQNYQKTLGTDAEKTFAASIWEPCERLNFPRMREFISAFKERYGQEPTYHAATAYAAGQILEEAIKLAGGLERERIRQALYDLDTFSIIGRYAVDKTGMQIKRFPLTIQWQNGKKEILWPIEFRNDKVLPVFFN